MCHTFGDHSGCSSIWCGALKLEDPSKYIFKDKGKHLTIKPFQTEEWFAKLSNCGSSQTNECVNGMLGTKALKIRHYVGSESFNFRVACGVSQYNDGHQYLSQITKKLGLGESELTKEYVETELRRQIKQQERRKKLGVKRRKELKKMKARKKKRLEGKEGSKYQTEIGLTEEGKEVT